MLSKITRRRFLRDSALFVAVPVLGSAFSALVETEAPVYAAVPAIPTPAYAPPPTSQDDDLIAAVWVRKPNGSLGWCLLPYEAVTDRTVVFGSVLWSEGKDLADLSTIPAADRFYTMQETEIIGEGVGALAIGPVHAGKRITPDERREMLDAWRRNRDVFDVS